MVVTGRRSWGNCGWVIGDGGCDAVICSPLSSLLSIDRSHASYVANSPRAQVRRTSGPHVQARRGEKTGCRIVRACFRTPASSLLWAWQMQGLQLFIHIGRNEYALAGVEGVRACQSDTRMRWTDGVGGFRLREKCNLNLPPRIPVPE